MQFKESQYDGVVCGIDEVGRGAWAGPVVSSAFCFTIPQESKVKNHIRDSKKLTKSQKIKAFKTIMEYQRKGFCQFSVGISSVLEIDKINILEATKLSMVRAFNLLKIRPCVTLVDGISPISIPCETENIKKGDELYISIAAASIVAKVTRDNIMRHLGNKFHIYKWDKNSGYGTADHRSAIAREGKCTLHRNSFSPMKNISKFFTPSR